jgi:hypothetical protein
MSWKLSSGMAILSLVLVMTVLAADPDQPHPHQGILQPYDVMPEVTLDAEQLEKLADGDIVIMTVENDEGDGRGIAVIDIGAPPDVVWSRINGFEHYPDWVGPVKECEVYARTDSTTFTRTKVSGFLYKYEYFLENHHRPDEDLVTWTLDYTRHSDFDDCVGGWFVEVHPDKEGWSRAWFANDLELRTPLPGFVLNWVKKKGLKDAVSWVRKQSEKVMEER